MSGGQASDDRDLGALTALEHHRGTQGDDEEGGRAHPVPDMEAGSRSAKADDSARTCPKEKPSGSDAEEEEEEEDRTVPHFRRGGDERQLEQPLPAAPEAGSNLHVRGLTSTVDDAALAAAFAPHGCVVSAKVMLHVETGVSRGFGFVLFQTAAEAEHARQVMQGASIHGHGGRLQITLSMHRGENVTAESRVVYVRHVPDRLVGSPELKDFMSGFGHVVKLTSHHVERRRATPTAQPSSLSNVTVTFGSIDAARLCVAACHGKTPLPQCRVPLLSKMEEPQTLREQRLRDQRVVQQQKAAEVPVPKASMIVAAVKLPHVPATASPLRAAPSTRRRSGSATDQPGGHSVSSSEATVSSTAKRGPQHGLPPPSPSLQSAASHHQLHHQQHTLQQQPQPAVHQHYSPTAPAGSAGYPSGGYYPMPAGYPSFGMYIPAGAGVAPAPTPFAAAMAPLYQHHLHHQHLPGPPFAPGVPPQPQGSPYPPGWHHHHHHHYTNCYSGSNSNNFGASSQQQQHHQQQQQR